MEDKQKMLDNVEIVVKGPDGKVKQVVTAHNLITTIGKEGLADRLLSSPSIGVPTHMAIGKSSEEAKAADTKLKEELDRNALASKTREGKVLTLKAEWAAGDGTGTLKEAGIFSASSEGSMWSRVVFEAVTKAAGDTLTITWKYTIE